MTATQDHGKFLDDHDSMECDACAAEWGIVEDGLAAAARLMELETQHRELEHQYDDLLVSYRGLEERFTAHADWWRVKAAREREKRSWRMWFKSWW